MKKHSKNQTGASSAKHTFSKETIDALRELGNVFLKIRKRLRSEGYTIERGKLKKIIKKDNH